MENQIDEECLYCCCCQTGILGFLTMILFCGQGRGQHRSQRGQGHLQGQGQIQYSESETPLDIVCCFLPFIAVLAFIFGILVTCQLFEIPGYPFYLGSLFMSCAVVIAVCSFLYRQRRRWERMTPEERALWHLRHTRGLQELDLYIPRDHPQGQGQVYSQGQLQFVQTGFAQPPPVYSSQGGIATSEGPPPPPYASAPPPYSPYKSSPGESRRKRRPGQEGFTKLDLLCTIVPLISLGLLICGVLIFFEVIVIPGWPYYVGPMTLPLCVSLTIAALAVYSKLKWVKLTDEELAEMAENRRRASMRQGAHHRSLHIVRRQPTNHSRLSVRSHHNFSSRQSVAESRRFVATEASIVEGKSEGGPSVGSRQSEGSQRVGSRQSEGSPSVGPRPSAGSPLISVGGAPEAPEDDTPPGVVMEQSV